MELSIKIIVSHSKATNSNGLFTRSIIDFMCQCRRNKLPVSLWNHWKSLVCQRITGKDAPSSWVSFYLCFALAFIRNVDTLFWTNDGLDMNQRFCANNAKSFVFKLWKFKRNTNIDPFSNWNADYQTKGFKLTTELCVAFHKIPLALMR